MVLHTSATRIQNPRGHDTGAILVIDDDAGTRETFEWTLRPAGFRVRTAVCGSEGIRIALTDSFDLLFVDQALPDMRGTEMIRRLQADVTAAPFVLISGFLTTPVTVDAMRLGALDVLEKPISVDDLPTFVSAALRERGRAPVPTLHSDRADPARSIPVGEHAHGPARPGSAAERWAMHVIKGCESTTDLKTLEQWAKCAGVSYTSLRESCRLVGIRPHDSRDLVRLLRAVIVASILRCPPALLLDVSDERTLASLLDRSGLDSVTRADVVSVEQFFENQRFVPAENVAVRFLHSLITDRGAPR